MRCAKWSVGWIFNCLDVRQGKAPADNRKTFHDAVERGIRKISSRNLAVSLAACAHNSCFCCDLKEPSVDSRVTTASRFPSLRSTSVAGVNWKLKFSILFFCTIDQHLKRTVVNFPFKFFQLQNIYTRGYWDPISGCFVSGNSDTWLIKRKIPLK